MGPLRRFSIYLGTVVGLVFSLIHLELLGSPTSFIRKPAPKIYKFTPTISPDAFDWRLYQEHYPASKFTALPQPQAGSLPPVQFNFGNIETAPHARERRERAEAVKTAFKRCWGAYRDHAWLHDELAPLSGRANDVDGGWAATLVSSLDTLWIMDLKQEFREAVDAVVRIHFPLVRRENVNIFRSTARYLGGLLSAYDLSGDRRLLEKALDLASMLYVAFDTPNRMPVLQWDASEAADSRERQVAPDSALLAEIGSLPLEFTRLSQITQDPKWYDAVARIMTVLDKQQSSTNLPGMWPLVVNPRDRNFVVGNDFALGARADTTYECLAKMYALLGGSDQYARMHRAAAAAAKQHAVFRPMNPQNADILMAGIVLVNPENHEQSYTYPQVQHVACFAGGMFALGGRLLGNDDDVRIGRQLTDGCIWGHEMSPTGIMPETFTVLSCRDVESCEWDAGKWYENVHAMNQIADETGTTLDAAQIVAHERLPPGISSIYDRQYLLSSQTIESIFVLFRTTGDFDLQDKAWRIFTDIHNHTMTDLANAALADVTDTSDPKYDGMESIWLSETLKYFYLTFSDTDVISLDDYVLNTEAHPLKRPANSQWHGG